MRFVGLSQLVCYVTLSCWVSGAWRRWPHAQESVASKNTWIPVCRWDVIKQKVINLYNSMVGRFMNCNPHQSEPG
jgi:hypothetical protein